MKATGKNPVEWRQSNVMNNKQFQQFMQAADRAKQYQQIKGLNERNRTCQPK